MVSRVEGVKSDKVEGSAKARIVGAAELYSRSGVMGLNRGLRGGVKRYELVKRKGVLTCYRSSITSWNKMSAHQQRSARRVKKISG